LYQTRTSFYKRCFLYWENDVLHELEKRIIRIAALARIVGWVKRDVGTIYVGFAYLNAPQKLEIAKKLANPTRSVANIGLTQPTIYRLGLRSGYPLWGT
jgi:hypothetical protein